jgi:hypothetical protein
MEPARLSGLSDESVRPTGSAVDAGASDQRASIAEPVVIRLSRLALALPSGPSALRSS